MFYTITERNDGFGGQYQTMICCILVAENNGHKYIHTPIKNIEHNLKHGIMNIALFYKKEKFMVN
jgi:hypothetical protein